MLRIELDGQAYLTGADEGEGLAAAVKRAADQGRTAEGALPPAVTWDASLPGARDLIRLGPGPLDDLLLGQLDATGCCAVLEPVLERLRSSGAIQRLDDTGAGLAVLARDGRTRVAHAEGPVGQLRPLPQNGARKLRPALRPEMITVVLLAPAGGGAIDAFFDALASQKLSSKIEVLVVGCGFDPAEAKALIAAIDRRTGREGGPRVRHFLLPGAFSEAYLANTGVALASGEAVIIAHAACVPDSPDAVQSLAGWALGSEVLTASPKIMDGSARVISAGLTARPSGGGAEYRVWPSGAPEGLIRRAAAPAPWFFAVNRKAWLEMGGAGPRQEALWTASLAREHRGAGRHLLIGSATAVWLGSAAPPGASAAISTATFSAEGRRSARWLEGSGGELAAASPKTAVVSGSAVLSNISHGAAFSDSFHSSAAMRLLVFADSFSASQSICFVEGLGRSRASGAVASRIVEESVFGPDGADFNPAQAAARLESEMRLVRPTTVVVSRFGHAQAYALIRAATLARGLPMVFHLDDDLFELPLCVGVERYRTARHPRRIHTLHRAMADADLTLAATPRLARRLTRLGDPRSVAALAIGSAGAPRPRVHKGPDQPLVVGYMGSASHNADLEMVAPALNEVLGRFDHVSIELFGSISDQPAADLLRGRVRRRKAIDGSYEAFRQAFAALRWDIGLAPLRAMPYNLMKTPTKWVEYAEAGVAAVVSDLDVYAPMVQSGAAAPATGGEWTEAISRLIDSPERRERVVAAADRMLLERYDWARLEQSVLDALARVERPALAA